jgi:COP9 signalosome complex subunit 6
VKSVHQNPALDLVGWYTLVPKSGPTPQYLPIHDQFLHINDSAILLGFHVEDIIQPAAGDPLPITIYESKLEGDDNNRDTADDEDKEMKDQDSATKMTFKFRELPYTTETGEAEMIAMQFIREGGANASASVSTSATATATSSKGKNGGFDKQVSVEADTKGKRRAVARDEPKGKASDPVETSKVSSGPDANLGKEELEFMSALQGKANAIRMMKARLELVLAYLSMLPPVFVAGQLSSSEATAQAKASAQNGAVTIPSNNILRHIQALVTNLHLAAPAEQDTLEHEIRLETNDVKLIALISDLMTSVNKVREVGKKFAAVEAAKNAKSRGHGVVTGLGDLHDLGAPSSAGDLFA